MPDVWAHGTREPTQQRVLFVCQHGYDQLHANFIGARNITMRTMCAQSCWAQTGHLSVVPDISTDEAKA